MIYQISDLALRYTQTQEHRWEHLGIGSKMSPINKNEEIQKERKLGACAILPSHNSESSSSMTGGDRGCGKYQGGW